MLMLVISLSLLFLKELNSSKILQVRLVSIVIQYLKKVLHPGREDREAVGLHEKSEIKVLCKRRFLHFHLNRFKKQNSRVHIL